MPFLVMAQHDPILYVYSESACNKFEHLTPTAVQNLQSSSALAHFSLSGQRLKVAEMECDRL